MTSDTNYKNVNLPKSLVCVWAYLRNFVLNWKYFQVQKYFWNMWRVTKYEGKSFHFLSDPSVSMLHMYTVTN